MSTTPAALARLEESIGSVIRGKAYQIRQVIICLLAEGHLLVEDVPGVGKTMLARSLASSMDASWRRIQFTPDLLPSDVTGVSIYNQASSTFEFHDGPVFANIVLADELNRASPKTQSALLEVMEERQVSVDGAPRLVPHPFMLIATQNPIDIEGTYRLPEAQIDRFMMRISLGYPDVNTEVDILKRHVADSPIEDVRPVVSRAEVSYLIEEVRRIHVSEGIFQYVARLADATRQIGDLRLGASPRATLALLRAAKATALMNGREFATPDDVKEVAPYVLTHRLIINHDAGVRGRTAAELLASAMDGVPVPTRRTSDA
jgi:MoxR-like ATPase